MSELFGGVVSIVATKRRRFLWVAWWSRPPSEVPFEKPDGSSGGGRTREEARAAAERAAGRALREIEPRWARAWLRVVEGLPPWPPRRAVPAEGAGAAAEHGEEAARPASPRPGGRSAFAILGVPSNATLAEIDRAFRRLALVTHPDRGGDPAAFIAVKRAHEQARARRRRGGGA